MTTTMSIDMIYHQFDDANLPKALCLKQEVEEGNVEYKFKLVDLSEEQFSHRVTQLHWRLNEGKNEAIYEIGYRDDGFPVGISDEDMLHSLRNLELMAMRVNCDISINKLLLGEHGKTAEILFRRKKYGKPVPRNVSICVVGALESGKTSLISVLSNSKNLLDNGRGYARNQIFRHQHEILSGVTSSVTRHTMYFSNEGHLLEVDSAKTSSAKTIDTAQLPGPKFVKQIADTLTFNHSNSKNCHSFKPFSAQSSTIHNSEDKGYDHQQRSIATPPPTESRTTRSYSEMDILNDSSKSVTFIDLAGHKKYFKNTLYGLMSSAPECCILTIAASTATNTNHKMNDHYQMTTEHLGVVLALNIPIIVVITKTETVTRTKLEDTVKYVKKLLLSCQRTPYRIDDEDTLDLYYEAINMSVDNSDGEGESEGDENNSNNSDNNEWTSGCTTPLSSSASVNDNKKCSTTSTTTTTPPVDVASHVPIFLVSNVTGQNISLLRNFLFRMSWKDNFWQQAKQNPITEIRVLYTDDNKADTALLLEETSNGNINKDSGGMVMASGAGLEELLSPRGEEIDLHAISDAEAEQEEKDALLLSAEGVSCGTYPPTGSKTNWGKLTRINYHESMIKYSNPSSPSAAGTSVDSPSSSQKKLSTMILNHLNVSKGSTTDINIFGCVRSGKITVHDEVSYGPNTKGQFITATINNIRVGSVSVHSMTAGQCGTIQLSFCSNTQGSEVEGGGEAVVVMDPSKQGRVILARNNKLFLGGDHEGDKQSEQTLSTNSIASIGPLDNITTNNNEDTLTLSSEDHQQQHLDTHQRLQSQQVVNTDAVLLQHTNGSNGFHPNAYIQFEAEILIIRHPNRIFVNYEPVVHIGVVRQVARLISYTKKSGQVHSNPDSPTNTAPATPTSATNVIIPTSGEEGGLKEGDKAICVFRFVYYPEYFNIHDNIILREGKVCAIGKVTGCFV